MSVCAHWHVVRQPTVFLTLSVCKTLAEMYTANICFWGSVVLGLSGSFIYERISLHRTVQSSQQNHEAGRLAGHVGFRGWNHFKFTLHDIKSTTYIIENNILPCSTVALRTFHDIYDYDCILYNIIHISSHFNLGSTSHRGTHEPPHLIQTERTTENRTHCHMDIPLCKYYVIIIICASIERAHDQAHTHTHMRSTYRYIKY